MNINVLKSEYNKLIKSDSNDFIIFYSSFEEHIVFLSKICKETNGQTLITCSSISEIKIIFKILKKYINANEIEIIHKNYSKNELLNKNKKIHSNKIKIILSTKTGIFSPFFNLKNIIIINEESKDHKQYDLNPRYNIKDICSFLSQKNNIKLILTSQAPSVETFYKNLTILDLREKNTLTTINIIDQKTEKRSKNEFYISTKLQEKIKTTLENNKKIIIINNNLKSEFKSNQKIKEEINNLFQTNIITIDSKTEINTQELQSAKILIGTEFFIKNFLYETKNIETIALLSLDNIINTANINTNEELFSYITFFINISKEKNIENLLIQSNNVENETLNLAINQDYKKFYEKEIKIREVLEYPPFSTIIDLIIKEKTTESLQERKNKILEILNKKSKEIEIIGERTIEKELKTKIRKQENISIKIPIKLFPQQKEILKEISTYCLIDIK